MNTEQQLFIQMGLLLSFVFLPLSNSWSPLLSKKKNANLTSEGEKFCKSACLVGI